MVWQSLEELITHRADLSQQDIAELPRGRIKITIEANGDWYYAGTLISRKEMVELFARQLIVVEGKYYLIAPEQLLQISVRDMPFVIVQSEISSEKSSDKILMTSNCGHRIVLGGAHAMDLFPLHENDAESFPCVLIENNLWARVSRNVFYRLAEHAYESTWQGRQAMLINSQGEPHLLGYL